MNKTVALLPLAAFLLLTACTSKGDDGASSTTAKSTSTDQASTVDDNIKKLGDKPLELTFYSYGSTFTDSEFAIMIADPIHKKYPNITVKRVTPADNTPPEEVLSTYSPDIIFSSANPQLVRTGVFQDLRDYIRKYQFDESRLKPIGYDYIKSITKGRGDAIVALPFNINQQIMYYNKDLFDKFGVAYPTNQEMTWDETLKIAAKLTRTENGVHYVGLAADNLTGLSKSLALPLLDANTGDADIDTPEWHKIFDLQKKIFEIPGYITADKFWNWGRDQFMKDQVIGMRVSYLANMVGPLEELRQQGVEFNWDFAPAPNFADQLPKTREAQIHTIGINSKSTHKDEAFQVLQELLSDDGQRIIARNGRVPAIINPDLEQEFGKDIPVLQGKTIQNIFVGTPLLNHYIHPYETDISTRMTDATEDLAIHGLDVNSAIRKATETINKDVDALRTTLGNPY